MNRISWLGTDVIPLLVRQEKLVALETDLFYVPSVHHDVLGKREVHRATFRLPVLGVVDERTVQDVEKRFTVISNDARRARDVTALLSRGNDVAHLRGAGHHLDVLALVRATSLEAGTIEGGLDVLGIGAQRFLLDLRVIHGSAPHQRTFMLFYAGCVCF